MGILGFPNPDQRQFPRIKDNIFIFGNLKLHSTNLGTNPLANPIGGFRVFAKNISAGGLMFETQRNIFDENDELELEIYQPLNRDKTKVFCIPVSAKVIWIKKMDKEQFKNGQNTYRIGIRFWEIKEEDRQKIIKYVKDT